MTTIIFLSEQNGIVKVLAFISAFQQNKNELIWTSRTQDMS
jgi:hypothetical protein